MAECPICHKPAHRIHSHYERTLADVPWSEYVVSWQLCVRKFFCTNPDCQRRINTIAIAWGGGALGTENLSPKGTTGSYRLGASRAVQSHLEAKGRFALSLGEDYKAVKAGVTKEVE